MITIVSKLKYRTRVSGFDKLVISFYLSLRVHIVARELPMNSYLYE